ncbi:MAG: BlaI/MecI/CopY family transcriptional regulator [Pirellulaceae bacterium]|nr:BlaI/MecI/CopY family transcriptional regulator [Pirellulaceae bacterium]
MRTDREELTRLEWVVMDALWQAERGTASDMQKLLQPSQGWAYSTVKTMLDRLVAMGYIQARRVGNVYEYTPKIKRPKAVGKVVDAMVDRLFGGEVAPLVLHLIERGDFEKEDVQRLKKILEQYQDE